MHPHANPPSKPSSSRHPSSTIVVAARRRPPFKLNHMLVVRSQRPNHRKKNHVKTQFVAFAIYRRSFAVVSRRTVTFSRT
jgi:hypothetical protein